MMLLSTHQLCLGYGAHAVAQGINLQVHAGDYLIICGENGSGKTTLMLTLLGLLPPLSGSLTFHQFRQEEIGYLPQQTEVQRDFPATVWEVALSGCLNQSGFRPFYTRAQKQRAENALALLGMTTWRRQPYRALSGGQQQRALLARALCAADRLLLLDEPAAGLDPTITKELYALIEQLNQQGMTILMVTHDLENALPYASHVLHLGQTPLFVGPREKYEQTQLYHGKNRGAVR